jgi:DNA-binding XRE family transcriptional regulator
MNTKNVTTKDIEKMYGPLTFGGMLKAYRQGEELTQVEMAKKLKISKQALNDIENGRKIPSIKRAIILAIKIDVIPELAVELVLQDQISREHLNLIVKVSSEQDHDEAA